MCYRGGICSRSSLADKRRAPAAGGRDGAHRGGPLATLGRLLLPASMDRGQMPPPTVTQTRPYPDSYYNRDNYPDNHPDNYFCSAKGVGEGGADLRPPAAGEEAVGQVVERDDHQRALQGPHNRLSADRRAGFGLGNQGAVVRRSATPSMEKKR